MILYSEKIKDAILTALADPKVVSIVDSTTNQSKFVCDIIGQTNMPHTSARRKIKWLVYEKLLVIDKVCICDVRKKYSLFHRVFRSITVRYKNNKILIETEQNIDPANSLTERFFSL